MSLYKRKNGLYYIDLFIGGKRIRRSTGTSNQKEAKELHDKIANERWKVERLGEKSERLWIEAVTRYLKESIHKRSLCDDIMHLDFIKQHWGRFTLKEINADAIDEIKQKRLATGVTVTTVNLMLAVIRIIIRKAHFEWDWVDKLTVVKLIPNDNQRTRWLTQKEATLLIKELPPHLKDMALFALNTGLRASNISLLKWMQINIERKIAVIEKQESKTKRAFSIPLNVNALHVILRQPKINEYVFNYNDKPVTQLSTRAFRKALKRAGIENFRWHDLRHTWASWHVQNGTSLQELQQLGGWSSYEMVLRYAHLSSRHLQEASEKICDTFTAHANLELVASSD